MTVIRYHFFAFVLAIIFGVLMILPFFYFQTTLGDEYKGILNQVVDDEFFYMTRIKDVMDGHPMLGNAYLLEHKNQLSQQLFLPEFLLAQPLKFLNLSVVQGRILYNFILPVIAFILTYLALYLIFPSRFWVSVFVVFLFFGLFLFKFTRPISPQFNFLFWLSQFIFLYFLIVKKDPRFLWPNIFNFGFLFYIYPYYWTFYLILFVVLAILLFKKSKYLFDNLIKILIGGFLLGLPYFYLTLLALKIPEYDETLTRLGLIYTRFPSGIKIVLLGISVLLLIFVFLRKKLINLDRETIFFISGILAFLIATNQHILTNRNLEFSSHYYILSVFFAVFALIYLLRHFLISYPLKARFLSILILVLMGFSVSQGLNSYISRALAVFEEDIYKQNYAEILKWLSKNTPKDSVVYANQELSDLIPVYTANNIFYSRNANLFFVSDEEVIERFVLNNYFEDFDRDFIVKNERAIWGVRYIDQYGHTIQANKLRKIFSLKLKSEEYLPEIEINKIIAKAKEIQKDDFEKNVKKYRVDYFVWDKNKNPEWRLNNQKFLEGIFEDKDFVIYRVL